MDINEKRAEKFIRKYGLTPSVEVRVELKKLLEYEIENYSGGSSEYLRVLSALLFYIGNVEDSILIFRAKMLNMDVGTMIDTEFLFGAGFGETLDFIKKNKEDKEFVRMEDFLYDYSEEYFDREEVVEEYIAYYTGCFSQGN